jgi:hypothetical protein
MGLGTFHAVPFAVGQLILASSRYRWTDLRLEAGKQAGGLPDARELLGLHRLAKHRDRGLVVEAALSAFIDAATSPLANR